MRRLDQFGEGAVARVQERPLAARHFELRRQGASSDFPDFARTSRSPTACRTAWIFEVAPYRGPLVFGPEIFEEINGKGFDPAELEEEVLKAEFDLAAALTTR